MGYGPVTGIMRMPRSAALVSSWKTTGFDPLSGMDPSVRTRTEWHDLRGAPAYALIHTPPSACRFCPVIQ